MTACYGGASAGSNSGPHYARRELMAAQTTTAHAYGGNCPYGINSSYHNAGASTKSADTFSTAGGVGWNTGEAIDVEDWQEVFKACLDSEDEERGK